MFVRHFSIHLESELYIKLLEINTECGNPVVQLLALFLCLLCLLLTFVFQLSYVIHSGQVH